MAELNVNKLLGALENETNSSIMNMTSAKIKDIKNNMLQRLQLDRTTLKTFHKKLKDYRYCSDMNDLQYGFYIRWISLKNPENLKLTTGGIIVDIDIISDCVQIRIKNNMNRIFQIKLDENMIFQKITPQEYVILGVLDDLEKEYHEYVSMGKSQENLVFVFDLDKTIGYFEQLLYLWRDRRLYG